MIFYGRFQLREVVRRLHHPNVIRLITPHRKSRMYMAMEYIDGVSLREMIRLEAPMAPEKVLGLAIQICEALGYMHANGVVHRDLKPENILVTAVGVVKIMDFGIALDEHARRLTWSGMSSTIGTPDYMAPEQVSGRRGDARTDLYSLGVILYEMLTGNLPFTTNNAYNMMRAKTNGIPSRPSIGTISIPNWRRSSFTPSSAHPGTATRARSRWWPICATPRGCR